MTTIAKKTTVANKDSNRSLVWKYIFKEEGITVQVCRNFILKLYQISQKLLRVGLIQGKIEAGDTFEEKRGKHVNNAPKSVWELAFDHLRSIPNKPSHYTKSSRIYFDDPSLTVVVLYNSFCEFYKEKTGNSTTMKYKTYTKFYKSTNYTVRKPKTDVCDYCTCCEQKLAVNPQD